MVSLIVVTLSFFLSPEKDLLSLASSLVGVTSLIFIAKGKVFGMILSLAFAVVYSLVALRFGYWGEIITFLFMTAPVTLLSIVSWIKHPYRTGEEVAVRPLGRFDVLWVILISLPVTVVFYFVLRALDTTNLLISTVSVTTSFIASALGYLRSPYYAVGYMANDVVIIALWVMASIADPRNVPVIFCFLMFFVNDLYAFINWRRMERRQTADGS